MSAAFEPPAGIDDWYIATAVELKHLRLDDDPAALTRALLGAFVDEISAYTLLVVLAAEIGRVFDHPSRDGRPIGERTARITRAILPLPEDIRRDCSVAAQLVGAGSRYDGAIASALALAVVRGPNPVTNARRVARIMLDILAIEPIALDTPTPTPEDPS